MTFPWAPLARRAAEGAVVVLLFLTPFSKAAIEILFPFLLLLWLLGWVRTRPEEKLGVWHTRWGRGVLLGLGVYLAFCVLSLFTSSNPILSLRGLIRKTLEYALFFVIAADAAKNPRVAHNGFWALVTAGCLVLAWGLLQEIVIGFKLIPGVPRDPILWKLLVYERMVGPYENPNDLATFLMVVACLLLSLVLGGKKRSIWLWALVLLFLGGMAWTHSRGALLGLAAALAFLTFLYGRTKKVGWLAVGLFLFVSAFLFIRKGHVLEVFAFADPGSRERIVMWRTAWHMIQARPIAGVGLNTFMFNYNSFAGDPDGWPAYAHNCFLQTAAEIGISGLLAFLAFLALWFFVLWRAMRSSLPAEDPLLPILAGMAAGGVAFLVQSAFDTNFYALRQATLFWTLAGVALGAAVGLLQRLTPPRA